MDFLTKLLQFKPPKSQSPATSSAKSSPAVVSKSSDDSYVKFAREFIEEVVDTLPQSSDAGSLKLPEGTLQDLPQPEETYKKLSDTDTDTADYESAFDSEISSANESFATDGARSPVFGSRPALDISALCNDVALLSLETPAKSVYSLDQSETPRVFDVFEGDFSTQTIESSDSSYFDSSSLNPNNSVPESRRLFTEETNVTTGTELALNQTVVLESKNVDNISTGNNSCAGVSIEVLVVKSTSPEIPTVELVQSELQEVEPTHSEGPDVETVVPAVERVVPEVSAVETVDPEVSAVDAVVPAVEKVVPEDPAVNTVVPEVETVVPEVPAVETVIPEVPAVETVVPEVSAVETVDPEVPAVETVVPAVETVVPEVPAVETVIPEVPAVETIVPEVPAVETVVPEVSAVETVDPEVPAVETVVPEVPAVETVVPEVLAVETVVPEVSAVETVVPEVPAVETVIPEVPAVETVLPEVPAAETVVPEVPAIDTVLSAVPEVPAAELVTVEVPAVEAVDPEVPAVESVVPKHPAVETVTLEVPVVETVTLEVLSVAAVAPEVQAVETKVLAVPAVEEVVHEVPSVDVDAPEVQAVETVISEVQAVETVIPEVQAVETVVPEVQAVETTFPAVNAVETAIFEVPAVETDAPEVLDVETVTSETTPFAPALLEVEVVAPTASAGPLHSDILSVVAVGPTIPKVTSVAPFIPEVVAVQRVAPEGLSVSSEDLEVEPAIPESKIPTVNSLSLEGFAVEPIPSHILVESVLPEFPAKKPIAFEAQSAETNLDSFVEEERNAGFEGPSVETPTTEVVNAVQSSLASGDHRNLSLNNLIELCKQQQKKLTQNDDFSDDLSIEDCLASEAQKISEDLHNSSQESCSVPSNNDDNFLSFFASGTGYSAAMSAVRKSDENVPLDKKWLSESRGNKDVGTEKDRPVIGGGGDAPSQIAQGVTSDIALNHSEAGPDTAHISASEEVFTDSAGFDFLQSMSNSQPSRRLGLDSLYVKFDPLVATSKPTVPMPPLFREDKPVSNTVEKEVAPSTPLKNPALASIDRLISISPSPLKQKAPIAAPVVSKEAENGAMMEELMKLREVLTEQDKKSQSVQSELRARVSELEAQLADATHEADKLGRRAAERSQAQQQMSLIMEEYEKTISRLVSEKEQDKQLHNAQLDTVNKEKDSALHHLSNIEIAFSDVHKKYERSKAIIEGFRKNEEVLRETLSRYEETIRKQEQKYDMLKSHAMAQLESANQELDNMRRSHQSESAKLKAMLKKSELKASSLEEMMEQKQKENMELASICDDLIAKVQ